MKKVISAIVILLLAVSAVACFAGCNPGGVPQPVATSYVSMEINPSISFVLDQNQKVMSLSCDNDDAMVMLYGEQIVGLDIQSASDKILELAVKMGYLTQDNCGVSVEVVSDGTKVESNILDKIEVSVQKVDDTLSFDVVYNEEGSFILNYELAKLKEKNPDDKNYQELTAGKLRLINSALACDFKLKMDDAVKMTTGELLAVVETAYSNMESYATEAFKQAKLAAQSVYEISVESAKEAVYLAKYIQYKGPIEGVLATAEYGGLSVAAKSIDLLAQSLVISENVLNKVLENDDVLAIAAQLGIDVDKLKDAEGNVTVDSVGNYVDKWAKNNADKMTEDMRNNLAKAVDKLEESKADLEGKPLSQDVVENIQTLLGTIEIKDIEFVDFGIEDLQELVIQLDKKASDKKAEMDASLSEEQKQAIAEAQSEAVAKLDGALQQYNKAVEQAAQDAKESLQYMKERRLASLANNN